MLGSRVRVCRAIGLHHASNGDAGVNLGSGELGMSEKCGHSLQRRIVIVHVGGTCVPQQVRMPFLRIEALAFCDRLHGPPDGAHVQSFY